MGSDLPPDPYAALGVARDSSLAAIKQAYRKLVLITHPDKVQDESLRAQKQDEFHKIQQAYELLSDEEKRREYEETVRRAAARKESLSQFNSRARGYQSEGAPEGVEIRTAAPSRKYEYFYEERKASRSSEDDLGYFEDRSSSRKHDQHGQPRKVSRGFEEKKSASRFADFELERERQKADAERRRASERGSQTERRRTREKERRRDTDEKYRRATVQDDNEEESDPPRGHRYQPEDSRRRRDDEGGRREDAYRRENGRRRNAGEESFTSDPKVEQAREYIEQTFSRVETSGISPVRPSGPHHRSSTSTYYIRPVAAAAAEDDTVRRSSARRSSERHRPARKDSSRDPVTIVEPPTPGSRSSRSNAAVPPLPQSNSSPSALRAAMSAGPPPRRAETSGFRRSAREEIHLLSRSSTMPVGGSSRRDALFRSSSKLHGEFPADSGYSSSGTPDSPPLGSSRRSPVVGEYVVIEEAFPSRSRNGRHDGAYVESASDSELDEIHNVVDDDDDLRRRVRCASPPPVRRSYTSSARALFGEVHDRSRYSTTERASSSYAYHEEPSPTSRRPSSARKESSRGASHLSPSLLRTGSGFSRSSGGPAPLGRHESSSHRSRSGLNYDQILFSPKYSKEDVLYSSGDRRGSFGDEFEHRDRYAFVHPGLMRAETSR